MGPLETVGVFFFLLFCFVLFFCHPFSNFDHAIGMFPDPRVDGTVCHHQLVHRFFRPTLTCYDLHTNSDGLSSQGHSYMLRVLGPGWLSAPRCPKTAVHC